jgi:hypothetical protein
MSSRLSYTLCGLLLAIGITGAAQAQINYDPANYAAMVSADSSDTIPPGTQITLQNWQKYKKFMPIGFQAMFSQSYPFKVGSGPDFTIEVGPTVAVPLAQRLKEDTEKYGGQAKLRKVDSGGYTIDG